MTTAKLSAETLKALAVRSDALGLTRFASHLAALAATGTAVWLLRGTWWVVPALFVHGFVLDFLFCALHEATHFTPFRSRWLNRVLGHTCGVPLLLPFGYFRLFHWDHHRYTQQAARDPELARPRPASWGAFLLHISGAQNWVVRIRMIVLHALTGRVPQPWVPVVQRAAVVREARIYLGVYVVAAIGSVLAQSTALLWLWVLPAMAGQLFLRQYLLAEHTACSLDDNPFANTRTTLTHPLLRFFAWNMPYHVEHHAYPAVPFHALPALHQHLAPGIQVLTPSYRRAMRDIRAYLFAGGR